MKYKTFKKDIWRSIRHSMSRFLAIFAIVALGAGFYAGLCSTAPDMRKTVDVYCDEGNMMDIELLSTLGFSQQDVDAIRERDGISGLMAGYSADVFMEVNGDKKVVRIHSLPTDLSEENADYINRPVLVEGRMPQAPDECLLGVSKIDLDEISVGSRVHIEVEDGELSDTLKYSEYTIVGMVQSPYYLSFTLGSSTIGSGSINHFMYVPQDAFCLDAYTEIFATVEGAAALNAFSQDYDDLVDPVMDDLESISDSRPRSGTTRYTPTQARSSRTRSRSWTKPGKRRSRNSRTPTTS